MGLDRTNEQHATVPGTYAHSIQEDLALLRASFGAWSQRREGNVTLDGAGSVGTLRRGQRLSGLLNDQETERASGE
jgi:hypothetical protein